MALTIIGTETGSATIATLVTYGATIPAGCEAVIAFVRMDQISYDAEPTLGGLAADEYAVDADATRGLTSVSVFLAPAEGALDFEYDLGTAAESTFNSVFWLVYVSGADSVSGTLAVLSTTSPASGAITSVVGDEVLTLLSVRDTSESYPGDDNPTFVSLGTEYFPTQDFGTDLLHLTAATSTSTSITVSGATEVGLAAVSFAPSEPVPCKSEGLTYTSICNSALYLIGAQGITDFATDASRPAVVCRQLLPRVRDTLLSMYRWNFAMTRETLDTPSATAPVWGYSNRFPLPCGLLRLWEVDILCQDDYRTEDWYIITNVSSVSILYSRKVTDPVEFTEGFCVALEYKLAALLAMALTRDKELRQALNNEADGLIADAASTEAQESRPRLVKTEKYVTARLGSGPFPSHFTTVTPELLP